MTPQKIVKPDLEILKAALQRAFVDRCRRNPAYSMRAFARSLNIDQSFLSKFLRGERSLSAETAYDLASRIGLKPADVAPAKSAKPAFLRLVDDEFSAISEWYHFAILELAKTKGFKSDNGSIAKRLGIHPEQVRDAVSRLQRLGLIRIERKKIQLTSRNNTWSNTESTTNARKLLQKSYLERAIEAIDMVPFEERENGSLTIAIAKSRIPEFKERLKEMRQELGEFFQTDNAKDLDEVYQLAIAFFPLSKGEK